ncbi:hypothetical protein F2P81_010768 [Scophthalmus maximus]|uniref:Uncharacterized protein n=1 Tax=Scophthalmus maximus TaxID=52904 RepID=A0A6A4T3T8_SCOMX|nr:hypothetical protein F2P81_010768 [Scophthalmus maximus]
MRTAASPAALRYLRTQAAEEVFKPLLSPRRRGEEEYFPLHPHWTLVGTSEQIELRQEKQVKKMKTLVVFLLCLVLLTVYTDANPIIKESFAKQLLRSKRQKPGYPDEPMRWRTRRDNTTQQQQQ